MSQDIQKNDGFPHSEVEGLFKQDPGTNNVETIWLKAEPEDRSCEDLFVEGYLTNFVDVMVDNNSVKSEERSLDVEELSHDDVHDSTYQDCTTHSKPPFKFSHLAFMAIEDSAEKALQMNDIYEWVMLHIPYYQTVSGKWKNSIRRYVSSTTNFRKSLKIPNALNKGSFWEVEDNYKNSVIRELQEVTGSYQAFVEEFISRNFGGLCDAYNMECQIGFHGQGEKEQNMEQTIEIISSENIMEYVEVVQEPEATDDDGLSLCICLEVNDDGLSHICNKYSNEVCGSEYAYKCIICDKMFAYKKHLQEHTKIHSAGHPYKCDQTFSQLDKIKNHVTVQHTLGRPYKCDQCEETFARSEKLKSHLIVHHTSERPYKCDICHKSFALKRYYQRHLKTHGERSLKCDSCNATFYQPDKLRIHKLRHVGICPYKCEECDKSYYRSDLLKRHMLVHTSEPHKCDQCDKTYYRFDLLKRHMLIHTSNHPYKCGECNSSYAHSKSLKEHMQIHTHKDLYECGECHATFAQPGSLKLHLLKHVEDGNKCDN